MKESGPIALRIGFIQLWQYTTAPINFTASTLHLLYILTIFEKWANWNHIIIFRPNLFAIQNHIVFLFQYYIISYVVSFINKFTYLTMGNVKHTRFVYRKRLNEFYCQRRRHLNFVTPVRHGLLTWLNRYVSRLYNRTSYIPLFKPRLNEQPFKTLTTVKNSASKFKQKKTNILGKINKRVPPQIQLIFVYEKIQKYSRGKIPSTYKIHKLLTPSMLQVPLRRQVITHLFLGPAASLIQLQNP